MCISILHSPMYTAVRDKYGDVALDEESSSSDEEEDENAEVSILVILAQFTNS